MSQSRPEPNLTSRALLVLTALSAKWSPSEASPLLLVYQNEFQASCSHFGTARFGEIFSYYMNINSLSHMLHMFDSNYVAASIPDEIIGFFN
jgi:hypothetical protein